MYTAINHKPKSKQPYQFLSARSGEFELEFKPWSARAKHAAQTTSDSSPTLKTPSATNAFNGKTRT